MPFVPAKDLDNLIQVATFAKQVLRAQHKKHGAIVAQQAMRDLALALCKVTPEALALANRTASNGAHPMGFDEDELSFLTADFKRGVVRMNGRTIGA